MFNPQASMPEADRHDTSAIYRKLTLTQLQRDVPQINWSEYLQATLGPNVRLAADEPIVSYGMPYMVEMGKILEVTDRRTVHNYVIWRLVMSFMTHMIDDYQRVILNIFSRRRNYIVKIVCIIHVFRNASTSARFCSASSRSVTVGHSAWNGPTRRWAWLWARSSSATTLITRAK